MMLHVKIFIKGYLKLALSVKKTGIKYIDDSGSSSFYYKIQFKLYYSTAVFFNLFQVKEPLKNF